MFRILKECYHFRTNKNLGIEKNITVYPEAYQTYDEACAMVAQMYNDLEKEHISVLGCTATCTGKYHESLSGLKEEFYHLIVVRDDQISSYGLTFLCGGDTRDMQQRP